MSQEKEINMQEENKTFDMNKDISHDGTENEEKPMETTFQQYKEAEERKTLSKELLPVHTIRSCYIPEPAPKFNTETVQNKIRVKWFKELAEKRIREGWKEPEISEEDKIEREKWEKSRKVKFSQHCLTDVNGFVEEYNDKLKEVIKDLEYFAEVIEEWHSSIDQQSIEKQIEWEEHFSNDPEIYQEQLKYQESYDNAKTLFDTTFSLTSVSDRIESTAALIRGSFI